ncbi:MAG: alpha-glucosidase [Lachnospiraceae bacterium]|nr:alpha-glucosidase [Lachnospiraceae bacterium]
MKNRLRAKLLIVVLMSALFLQACYPVEITINDNRSQTESEDMSLSGSGEGSGGAETTGSPDDNDDLEWWQETNVYEIYVKSYKDSDGDGIGDLNGIIQSLDHLRSLGVGAIWLTPVYASPQADNGYDIADYYEIDEMYGSMEDMDRLIKEAEKRDIKIVMDLVFNHTSDQNEWFLESRASKDNDKSDWYIWMDPKEDGSEPNNWRSIFGGSAWTYCEERGQYYLHTFLSEQPDVNWENPKVRQALYDVANYWLDKGVGGFRMDAVTYIKKPESFEDGTPDAEDGMTGVHSMTANTEGILDYLHEFKENVTEGKDIFTVGEANGVKPSDLPYWVGEDGVFDMVFEFSHVNVDVADETNWCETKEWKLTDLKKCISDSQESTKDNGWYPIFFENHDLGRSINHYCPGSTDPDMSAKALGTALLTLRGTPFIYEGEELGFVNTGWDSIDDYSDISTINHYEFAKGEGYSEEECMEAVRRFSRDNARTPMQWNEYENAGFTTGTPWLPVYEDYKMRNVDMQTIDPDSVLSWYRTLSEIRSSNRELLNGDYEEILKEDEQIFAYKRDNGENTSVVLINLSNDPAEYDASLVEEYEFLISSYDGGKEAEDGMQEGEKKELKPYEAVIYRR